MIGGGIAGFRSTQGAGARTLATANGLASGVARSASAVSAGMRGRRSSASIGAGILSSGVGGITQAVRGAGGQQASQVSNTGETGTPPRGGGHSTAYSGDGELSDIQIAEAESAGMDVTGVSSEEYYAESQSHGIEQLGPTAEEKVKYEDGNPARSAGQQAYKAQAQDRLTDLHKENGHTAGNVNAQIRNQRIADDTANNRKER